MIRILGMQKLKRKFDILPDVLRLEIRAAMEASAREIVDLAKSLVPKDSHELEESIDWTWGKAPRGALTLGTVQGTEKAGDLTITIFAGNDVAYYARWVEFGTRPHNSAKGGGTVAGRISGALGGGVGHPGSRAQPFFFVSYRALRKRANSRINRATTAAGRKVARS